MRNLLSSIRSSKKVQFALLLVYMLLSTLWVHTSRESVFGFIFFVGTVLAIYYSNLGTKLKMSLGGIVIVLLIPFIGSNNAYYLDVATQMLIYVALALGLNIVIGFSGIFNLGYAAFYAVGAYLWAEFGSAQAGSWIPGLNTPLNGNWFWIFLLIGITVTGLVGVLLGLPALKVKGDYLAVITLGFAEIVRLMFNNLDKPINISGGPRGISAIQSPAILGMQMDNPIDYYFISLLMILLIVTVTKRLEKSRIGRAWAAIRDDEIAARAMGIKVVRLKLLAFAFGASFAGAMGVIFAAKQGFIDPTSFTFNESALVLAMVILGGTGSIPGAIIGACALIVLKLQVLKGLSDFFTQLRNSGVLNIPSQLEPVKYENFILGILMVVMMRIRPQGMIPATESHITVNLDETDGMSGSAGLSGR